MTRKHMFHPSTAVVGIAGLLGTTHAATAQPFSLISQSRSVSGWVAAFQCDGQFVYDQKQASGFELFDATAHAEKACPAASSVFTATQFSTASTNGLVAFLEADSVTQAGPQNGMYAIANSAYSVNFEVTSAVDVTLKGSIFVDGAFSGGAGAQVTLFMGEKQPIVSHWLEQGVPATTEDFSETLRLDPGVYELWVLAHSEMYKNNAGAKSTAAVVLEPTKACAGDIDGDGKTCQSDLGLLLAAFGTCAGEPGFTLAANLSLAGASAKCIDQSDLGVLLGDYGCGECP